MSNLQLRAASWEAGSEGKIVGYAVVFEQRTVLYTDPVTNLNTEKSSTGTPWMGPTFQM